MNLLTILKRMNIITEENNILYSFNFKDCIVRQNTRELIKLKNTYLDRKEVANSLRFILKNNYLKERYKDDDKKLYNFYKNIKEDILNYLEE